MKTSVNRIALLLGLGVALSFWSLAPGSLSPVGDRTGEIAATQRGLNVLFGEIFDVEEVKSGTPRSGFVELIAHVPFVLASRLAELPENQALVLALQPVLLSTLIVVIVFVWSHRLTGDRLRAVGYALLAAFCTMIWPYAYFGMEVQQSLFLILAAFLALSGVWRRSWTWWIVFGVCCGLVISVKISSIFLAPVIAFLMLRSYAADQTSGRTARLSVSVAIAVGMLVANTMWRNRMASLVADWTTFLREHSVGDPLEWAFNAVALFSSPGKGLIVYIPAALVATMLFRRAWAAQRDLAIFGLLSFVSLTAALAAVDVWSDETWGPRHFHALAAPAVLLIAGGSRAGAGVVRRAPLFAAAFLGLCVSFLGAFYHYGLQQRVAETSGQSTLQTLQMNPMWNHVKFNARLLRVWIVSGDGDQIYWNPHPIWYYDIPEWSSNMEPVRIDPYSQPQPLLIERWGERLPGPGWLSVFLSLLAGPALILLSIGAARNDGGSPRAGLRDAGLFWSICVAIVYVSVCVFTLYNPFGPGLEKTWAIPLLILVAVVLAAHLFAKWFLQRIFPLLILLASVVILVRSGSVGAFLVAAFLFIAAYGFGDGLTRLLRLTDDGRTMEMALCRLMAGFGVVGVFGFILAILHLLDVPVVAALLAAGVLLAVRSFRSLRWKGSLPVDEAGVPEAPALLAMGGYIMLLNLVWAVAPEVQFDALNYHLHLAAAWARAGGAVDVLYTTSYLAGLVETIYALTMVLSAQTPKMISFGLGLAVAFAVFAITDRIAGRRAAMWACLLFYSIPLIIWMSSTTDVELALAAFIVTLAMSLIRWWESRSAGWLYLAAILFGAGIATKPTMAHAAFAFGAALVLYIRSEKGFSRFRTVAIVGLLALAVSVPWYALRAHQTGNPVYPVLNERFPVQRYVDEELPPLGGRVRVPLTAASLIRFPVAFTFDTVKYSESGVTSGGVGPWFLLALPVVAIIYRQQFAMKFLYLLGISYVVLWMVMFSYARFFAPVLPILVAIGVAAVFMVTRERTWLAQAILILIFAGQALSMPVQFWLVPDRIPIRQALGLETEQEFLSRVHRGYGAVSFLNSRGAAEDTAIGVGIERVRFYLDMPYHSWRDMPELRQISHLAGEAEVAAALAERGYDWLIIDEQEPAKGETYLRPEFLECFADLQFSERTHSVYRLLPLEQSCAAGVP